MKALKTYFLSIICVLLCFNACKSTKEPLPPLSYEGDDPRVQLPLSPEDSRQHIQLPDGFSAELFAAEPDIINPIAFTWDERGRLWVIQSQDYPHQLENEVGGDRITICEDTDGDGKADLFIDFATEQGLSTGITLVKGGAIVAQAPEMVFLEDTNGDDKMDKRTVLFDGFGTWDTHAGPSNLHYGIDNAIWGAVGYSGFENEFDNGRVKFERGVYRFGKDGSFLEPVGQFDNNTWGMGFNEHHEVFGSTANNNHACYVGIPLRYYDYLDKKPSWAVNADFIQGHYEIHPVDTIPLQQVDVRGGYTAASGANFYTANNYPAEYRNQMYVAEPTGHLVHIAKIEPEGAGYREVDGGNIFASTDAWTAPVFAETGPDGNLWIADWYNPVIQHNPDKRGMENQIWNAEKGEGNAHLNDHRDYGHGRIYIIRYKGKNDSSIQHLHVEDGPQLIKALKSENQFWRMTAQRMIVENNKRDLIPDLVALAKSKSIGASHALWTLHGLDAKDAYGKIIEKALKEGDYTLKKAAIALLPESVESSKILANSDLLTNEDQRIRLAAILKASELPETPELYQEMEEIAKEDSDKWLTAATKIYFKELNNEEVEADAVEMVIPSAEQEISQWNYTTDQPSEEWMSVGFDDKDWKRGAAIFGDQDEDRTRTKWTQDEIWMRKVVNLNEDVEEPVIKIVHDDDYEIYINGQLLKSEVGSTGNYKYLTVAEENRSLFNKGKLVMAVYCKNTGGRQHIDVGIGKMAKVNVDKTFNLKTVPQEMAYDQTELKAEAGQIIEIKLENVDQMPHNLVVITPGSLATFGSIVDQFLTNPKAEEMGYIPNSRYVLGATEILDPNETGSIIITLPDEPGTYPFVCTFPGHWRMMQGVIIVTSPSINQGVDL